MQGIVLTLMVMIKYKSNSNLNSWGYCYQKEDFLGKFTTILILNFKNKVIMEAYHNSFY